MDLIFTINDDLLLTSMLFNERPESKNLYIDLKNRLWDKYRGPYELFIKRNDYRKIFTNFPESLEKLASQTLELLEEGKVSSEYRELRNDTDNYKIWLETAWSSKKNDVEKILKNLLRIKLPETEIAVFVVDPKVGGGSYIGNNHIFWGHKEDWPNYNIVYLAHEFLHSFIPSGDTEHCVIELVTDNELRIQLIGRGDYFNEGGISVGHDNLIEKEKEMLPRWNNYLRTPDENIFQLIEDLKIHENK